MPINLKANFKSRVEVKKSEKCSWRRHCRGCARDLLSYLDFLASKNPDRFVFARIPAIVKGCNGKYRKNGEPYSLRMVQECLRVFREHKIVSQRRQMDVDFVPHDGFVVAPHDSMTIRYPRACVVGGVGKGPGTWVDDVWVQDPAAAEWFGLVVENTAQSTSQIVQHTTPQITPQTTPESTSQSVLQGPQKCADECAVGCADDPTEPPLFEEDTAVTVEIGPEVSLAVAVPSLVSPVSQLASEPGSQRNMEPVKKSDYVNDDEPERRPQTSVSAASKRLLTDENAQPSASREVETTNEAASVLVDETVSAGPPAAAVMTVGQYFESSHDVIRLVTDGELQRSNSSLIGFDWSEPVRAVNEAVRRKAGVPLKDRTTLGSIMGAAMNITNERHPPVRPDNDKRLFTPKHHYPKAWLSIKGTLMQGGPLQLNTLPDLPKSEADTAKRIALWEAYRNNTNGHHATLESGDAPGQSNWYFETRLAAFMNEEQYQRLDPQVHGDVDGALAWIEKEK